MSRPPSATSALALQSGGGAHPVRLTSDALGDATSRSALARLNAAVGELKALAVKPLLQSAGAALNIGDHQTGAEWSIKALEQDERCGLGWYFLAVAREMAGDFAASIRCYEAALALMPDHAEITNNLGRLAFRLGQVDVAEQLFRHHIARFPESPDAPNNLGCALRDQGRFEEAVEVLRTALMRNPGNAIVWNTLGTVMAEQGDMANGRIFFDEALRLDPLLAKARYNRGNMNLALGDAETALADCEEALRQPMPDPERIMMRLARSTILINLGRAAEGWEEYDARLDPQFADVTIYKVGRPRWTPGADVSGKSFLLIGEQGLGDEILFGNYIPDLLEALGPEGRLTLAVEPRLVPLFQRSFPGIRVGAHLTYMIEGRAVRVTPFLGEDLETIDLWAPLATPLRQYRPTAESFPDRVGYLSPDPDRVAYWRALLQQSPAGKKVGLLWKSAISNSGRHRFFSPFQQWAPVLKTPGVTFVNLQYGDCAAEIEQARREFGVDIWSPPGIDLKQDLDDLAALSCALDLTLGFSNATLNIAAGCGAPTWLISTPSAWPRIGTDRYPWYPQVRVFLPPAFADWEPVMTEVADELANFAA
jgi:tetratricopeptide (TPR) repeat protein